jgi:hypothetical protein
VPLTIEPPRPHREPCSHHFLHTDVSPSAARTPGFKHYFHRVTYAKRLGAATADGEIPKFRNGAATARAEAALAQIFPAPPVLLGDYLPQNPRPIGQSFAGFNHTPTRRPVKNTRAVYVVPPPLIPDELAFMRSWSIPSSQDHVETSSPVNMTESLCG